MIGCGRVGSAVALQLQGSGWDVTVLDENEDALGRLGDNWTGGFLVGHGMDLQLLREAGIEEADAVVVTTDGDNTNIVIAPGGAEAVRGADGDRPRARPGARAVLRVARAAHRLPDLVRDRDARRRRPRRPSRSRPR